MSRQSVGGHHDSPCLCEEAPGYLHTAEPLMLSVASGTSRWLVSFPDYIHSVVFDTLFQPLGAFFPLSDLLGLRLVAWLLSFVSAASRSWSTAPSVSFLQLGVTALMIHVNAPGFGSRSSFGQRTTSQSHFCGEWNDMSDFPLSLGSSMAVLRHLSVRRLSDFA